VSPLIPSGKRVFELAARHPSLTVMLSAAAVFTAFLAAVPSPFRAQRELTDYDLYYRPLAESLLHGRGWVPLAGVSPLHVPPGYPYILVVVYRLADVVGVSQATAVTAFTVLAMAAAAVVVFLLARTLFGVTAAWVAAALWTTYPVNLLIASYRFSEVPYTLVLLTLLLVLVSALKHQRRLLVSSVVIGSLVGLAALIRPAAIGLTVPITAAILLYRWGIRLRARLAASVLVFAAFLLSVAPWQVWASHKAGRAVLLTDAGVSDVWEGLSVGARPDLENGKPFLLPGGVLAMSRQMQAIRPPPATWGNVSAALAQKPFGTVAEVVATKAIRTFYATNTLKLEPLILLVHLPYLALFGAGMVCALRRGDPLSRWCVALFSLVVGYSWVITMLVLSILRYISPALGLLAIPGSLAVISVAGWVRDRAQPRPCGTALAQAHQAR
jgi:4-amino-4-deoxy-L-arabinose transferase-like glycosyltransferase